MESIRALIEPYNLHRLTGDWLEKAVESSFYPDRARVNFHRFFARVIETDANLFRKLNKRNIPWISLLFSGSQILTELAMKDPGNLFWALHPSVLHSTRFKAEMRREREAELSGTADPKETLCAFKQRELMRIGWRDLLKWADTVETLEDLSRLADVSIEGAYNIALKEMEKNFGKPVGEDGRISQMIVIGLGKLGGRELNFSSDIDLMYIIDNAEGQTRPMKERMRGTSPKLDIKEFHTRVARRMTSILNDIGPAGNVFRVDLNLRPEGSRGPLVITLAAAELYYESWGQPWERQMLIKARVCAGDPALGDSFIQMVKPFVYKKYLDYSHLKEIQQMKAKIDRHLLKGRDKYKNNVKLGKGGIREIEFIIQTYQLIYGGKMPWLAEINSLKALHRIFERGLLGTVQYAQLADGLLLLRDLENRMQITYGRQVQILPEKDDELQALALKMNLRDKETLLKTFRRVTDNVHDIFVEFFKEESAEPDAKKGEYFIDLDNEEEATAKLAELNFQNPRQALDSLLHIRDGEPFNHPSSKSRRMFTRLLPDIMEIIVSLPEQDKVLICLDKFISAREERESLYEVFLKLPSSGELLVTLFSLAPSLSDTIINHQDALEILSEGVNVAPKHSLKSAPEYVQSYDTRLDWLRRERNAECLRISTGYLFSHSDPFALMEQLSILAGEFVDACLGIIKAEMDERGGIKANTNRRLAVIGLGKLGRRELNFGSDLDLMFVYSDVNEADPAEAHSYYSSVCRKLLSAIGGISQHGYAYKVDTRLRPEGEKGGIVISETKGLEYYAKRGALWERMALSGARVVAGNREIGEAFLDKLTGFVYGQSLSEKDKDGIAAMKRKMEREKIRKARKVPIKYGRGGIVDIEFLAQKLKLAHGMESPEIRGMNSLEMLRAAEREGWGVPDIQSIIRNYKLLRTVETHMRMETGLPAESLPDRKEALDLLEKKVGRFFSMDDSPANTVRDAMEEVRKSLDKMKD